ncbi:hypothetical protein LIER_17955 [Lithospermum erythrorhizon]|uniref:Transposase (putative) gypsy type domain-containing protein n=1 Tax=Lithospermum erythrorhizon TaxID=34254 RepID=A0AAV3QEP8_LITER
MRLSVLGFVHIKSSMFLEPFLIPFKIICFALRFIDLLKLLFNPLFIGNTDMSSGNNQEPSRDAPNTSTSQPATNTDPPVMLIDLETLAFFRFWTSAGAEVTYGDLTFSQDHDPFGNLLIPQEVSQAVFGQGALPEADELSGATDIPSRASPSPEPITIRPPSTSNVPASHSKSPSAEGSQNGGTPFVSGTVPTIIRDSLPVLFSEADLRDFRRYFSIPSYGDQVFEPRLYPSCSKGPYALGWTSIHIESLNYGARFPFSPFVNGLLIFVNQAPGQISHVGWLTVTIFIVACRMANIEPNLPLFFNMHSTSHSSPLTSFSSLSEYNIFVEDKPDKVEEVLTAALSFMEARKVPFSTMVGKPIHLFKRAKVVTKIMPESIPASTDGSTTALGKRSFNSDAPSKPVFAKRTKTLAHKYTRPEIWDLTKEPLQSVPPSDINVGEVPLADTPLVSASSYKGKEIEDSVPKVTTGYFANYLDLPYTLLAGQKYKGKEIDDSVPKCPSPILLISLCQDI